MNRILLLGGYGNTGRQLAEQLLQLTPAHLVLAGRHVDKAQALAKALNLRFDVERVAGAFADATDAASLRQAFSGVDMVAVVSSTAEWTQNVAQEALRARIDYLDVQYSAAKLDVLQRMAADIEAAGCCFVADGGFHPGLPAALVRAVAPCFDTLQKANAGSLIKIDWRALELSEATMVEFVSEFLDWRSTVFRDGRWQEAGMGALIRPASFDFGENFGRQPCIPMYLEEMRAIPQQFPTIEETGFYVGGFNWFTDWLVSPLVILGLKLAPRHGVQALARLFRWSLNTFSRLPYATMLRVQASGLSGGQRKAVELTVFHRDGYTLTTAPVTATMLQLLDGSKRRPGLHLQAHLVEPQRLLRDMERMGVEICLQESGGDRPSPAGNLQANLQA